MLETIQRFIESDTFSVKNEGILARRDYYDDERYIIFHIQSPEVAGTLNIAVSDDGEFYAAQYEYNGNTVDVYFASATRQNRTIRVGIGSGDDYRYEFLPDWSLDNTSDTFDCIMDGIGVSQAKHRGDVYADIVRGELC